MAQTTKDDTASLAQAKLASIVRAELARRRMTGRDLGKIFEWSERTTRRRLSGDTPFRVDELARIADFVHIPVAALLHEHETAA